MDTSGADHLHGGEEAMASDVGSRLRQAGIHARIAISGHMGLPMLWRASLPTSRRSPPLGQLLSLSNGLRSRRCGLPADLLHDLRRLGLDRVSDLLPTPQAPLALRFGPVVGRRLDQANGSTSEPTDPVRPAEMIEVRRTFVEPIGAAEAIARYARRAALLVEINEPVVALRPMSSGSEVVETTVTSA
jgi:protein ImuB